MQRSKGIGGLAYYVAMSVASSTVLGTTVEVISLDAGNTILFCDPSPPVIYQQALGQHGRPVSAEEVAPVFRETWAEMQRLTRPGKDRYSSVEGGERAWWGTFLKKVLDRLDHDAAWQPLLDNLYAAFADPALWQVYPEVRSSLEQLSEQGYRFAIISNWDRRLPEILRGLDLEHFFETITVSSIEEVEKPAAEIFHRTLSRLGVAAAATVHVGDSPREDYQGAADAGLLPVLIDRKGLFRDDEYRRVAGLDGLFPLLSQPPGDSY